MFTQEALIYGIREGIKAGALYIVWAGIFKQGLRVQGFRALLSGVAIAFLLIFVFSTVEAGMIARELSQSFAGYVLFVFFFIAAIVLLRFPSAEIGTVNGHWPLWAHVLVFLGSVFYFAPDSLATAIYLRDMVGLKQSVYSVYANFGAGVASVLIFMYYLSRRLSWRIGKYFGLAQLMIFLVLLKLLLGGTMGTAEFSLVPTVQRGVMKFVHDLIHQSFLYLMVPDHPMLKVTTWNFVGFFFGPDFSIALALCLLLTPTVFYLYATLTAPVSYPDTTDTGADRRLVRTEVRRKITRRMIPIATFVLIVAMSWYSSGSEKGISLYVPEPKPLIADKGMVIIPITSPGANIMDGKIHKFSILVNGKGVRLLLVRKPDGSLAVTLDACEICPPDGYGQRGEHAVCIYCRTPIPLDTLGKPGGCNPIPLEASITDRDVRVTMEEISTKWNLLVNSRSGGER